MCGISGIFLKQGRLDLKPVLEKMNYAQRHRGPDDEGAYIDGNVGLGHRRLAIIDTSKQGRQPFCNEDGTLWLVHNGEIYNYLELRRELTARGHVFRTNTDSEVILHAYEEWEEDCLGRFNGMWAFCIWDRKEKKMFLSRDRLGLKQLYYYSNSSVFIFASEIKALLASGLVPREPNNPVIYDYLAYGLFSNTQKTFFRKVEQLPAGCRLEINTVKQTADLSRYWSLKPQEKYSGLGDEDYKGRFLEIFRDAVRLRMRSDVPLGAFLSGGLDSASVVSLIHKISSQEPGALEFGLHTITNIYKDKSLDETGFVKSILKDTGFIAHYAYPDGDRLRQDIGLIFRAQEEPVGNARIYSQWESYRMAKECGLKVVIDGQGGDEILAGYTKFYSYYFAQLLRSLKLSTLAGELLIFHKVGQGSLSRHMLNAVKNIFPHKWRRMGLRAASRLRIPKGINPDFAAEFRGGSHFFSPPVIHSDNIFDDAVCNIVLTLLPTFKMTDRTASYFSIENRSPFLDYRLVEFMLKTPVEQKIRNGTRKYLLRQAMRGILPEGVRVRRDKMQFPYEQDAWFKGYLSDLFRDILYSSSFKQRPFVNHKAVEEEWNNFCGRKGYGSERLWFFMNLELWARMYIDGDG